jgi:diguanylate cyclase (GGDEF)-like protein
MEYSEKDIYVIIAIPIDLPDRRVVLEIIKNTTNSLILETDNGNIYSEVHELIDKMNNLALKDSLTGIYNRRYINEKLPLEITGAQLTGKDISVIMTDIDFFKRVNDTYGHLCGDRTLKKYAKILSQSLSRDIDWVARFGGEEFLICLPGVSKERAIEVAEKMRSKLENSTLDCGQNKIKITASFGVFTGSPQMKYSMNDMIKYADAKLYEAKNNGRNRVEA